LEGSGRVPILLNLYGETEKDHSKLIIVTGYKEEASHFSLSAITNHHLANLPIAF
jgi:hypothetical protein